MATAHNMPNNDAPFVDKVLLLSLNPARHFIE